MRFYDQLDLGITAEVSSRSKIVILELHCPYGSRQAGLQCPGAPGTGHIGTEHSVTEKVLLDNADGAIGERLPQAHNSTLFFPCSDFILPTFQLLLPSSPQIC